MVDVLAGFTGSGRGKEIKGKERAGCMEVEVWMYSERRVGGFVGFC